MLRELLAQGGVVDLSENSLDDAGAFTALSGAVQGSTVFLQDVLVRARRRVVLALFLCVSLGEHGEEPLCATGTAAAIWPQAETGRGWRK